MTTLGQTTVQCPGCGEPVTVDLKVTGSERRDRELVLTLDGKSIARQIDRHVAERDRG